MMKITLHAPGRPVSNVSGHPARGKAAHTLRLLAGSVMAASFAMPLPAAAEYPERPVTMVNPSSPGGGADVISRILAQALSQSTGKQFIVENRPGAANMVATEIVARAKPDGYTLLIAATGTFVTNPLVYANMRYSLDDFEPITNLVDAPFILNVHPSLRATTVKELVELASSKPGDLAFASFGQGSSSHMAGELLQTMAGIKLLHVPYKGSAPGMADLVAGHVSMNFDSAVASLPQIQAGKIRPLGVAGRSRLAKLPDVPTLEEAGLPDFLAGTWYGVMAPAGTPKAIVDKLHQEFVQALQTQEVRDKLAALSTEILATGPADFKAQIVRERERWSEVARHAGIKPE